MSATVTKPAAIYFGNFVVTAQVHYKSSNPSKSPLLTLLQGLSSYTTFIRSGQLEAFTPWPCSRVP